MTEPTKLEMLAAEINGTATSEYVGLYKQIPFRVRLDLFARLSALHEIQNVHAKTPRNALLNDLLDIAMDMVIDKLDDETAQHLERLEAEYNHHLSEFESGELNND